MNDVVLRAEGLGKKYVIGHKSEDRSTTFRDALTLSVANFVRSGADLLKGRPIYAADFLEDFWALRDLNFEIRRGDIVGIIGRNGAGKSTLLKILSRITEPTKGRLEIVGRVASLLEVGTGFHPELTGRENIILNGAILGMQRSEIRTKFDEIVEFAGVEKFIDTPVKRYSSGMYIRLAFSVAAHLEPEILIVDEVLAVGDSEFQQKCLGKMDDVAKSGRTVLFVSHNLPMIEQLAVSGMVLNSGQLEQYASIGTALDQYRQSFAPGSQFSQKNVPNKPNSPGLFLEEFQWRSSEENVVASPKAGDSVTFEGIIGNNTKEVVSNLQIALAVRSPEESMVLLLRSDFVASDISLNPGNTSFRFDIPRIPLSPGRYGVDFRLIQSNQAICVQDKVLEVEISGSKFFQNGQAPNPKIQTALTDFEFSVD